MSVVQQSNDIPFNPLRRYTKRCPSDNNRYRRGGATTTSSTTASRSTNYKQRSHRTRDTSSSSTSTSSRSSRTTRTSRTSRNAGTSQRSVTPDPESHTVLREVHYVDALNSAGVQQRPAFETRARSANMLYLENSKKAATDACLERGNPFPYEMLPITKDQSNPLATGCAYSAGDIPKMKSLPLGQSDRSMEQITVQESTCVLEPYNNFFLLKNNAEGYEYQTGLRSVPPTPLPMGVLPPGQQTLPQPALQTTGNYMAISGNKSNTSDRESRYQSVAAQGPGIRA